VKRTPLRRTVGLTSRTPLHRRTGVNPVSKRRQAERPQRDSCRAIVLERDGTCRYPGCRAESTDVHELHRGAGRHADYLDPESCRGMCRPHHDFVSLNPNAARELGLALRNWGQS
jgi:hypothetical protein